MKYDRGELEFTDEEAVHLASWENQVKIIRVRVGQCVSGKITGFYLWGEGGRSKSYTVLKILDELGAEYRHHQGRLSAVGLVQELEEFPNACHVIEDLERLLREKDGANLLRAALWSQSKAIPMARPIRWKVNKKNIAFDFTGSIIITSNEPIGHGSVLAALHQRLRPYHLAATRDELKAVMKTIALKGHEVGPFKMTPAECMSVFNALIEGNHPLDIRTLINGFTEFITEREGESLGVSWKDLLASMVHGKSSAIRKPTREEVMQRERGIAAYIDGLGDLRAQSWAGSILASASASGRRKQARECVRTTTVSRRSRKASHSCRSRENCQPWRASRTTRPTKHTRQSWKPSLRRKQKTQNTLASDFLTVFCCAFCAFCGFHGSRPQKAAKAKKCSGIRLVVVGIPASPDASSVATMHHGDLGFRLPARPSQPSTFMPDSFIQPRGPV